MGTKKFNKILVTGASGFIGGWVARALIEQGYPVRALYHRKDIPEHLMRIRASGTEVEQGDLTRVEDVRKAVRNVDAIIHLAALTSDWGSYKVFKTLNYDLTIRLLEEAQNSGCSVFVYISSVAMQGFGKHVNSSEEGPYYRHINPYQIYKKLTEDYVLSKNSKTFRTTAIRPGNVFGPGDTTMFYRIFEGQEKGIMAIFGGGKKLTCPVYIEDVVEAIILSLENEKSAGEAFNITGGEEVTWKELLDYTSFLLEVKSPWLNFPIPLAWILAHLMSGFYKLFHIKSDPPLTPYRLAQLAHDFNFSTAKAYKILGYSPKVEWQEGMRCTVEAYQNNPSG